MKGLEQLKVGELYNTTTDADSLLEGLKCNTRLSIIYIQLPTCEESYYYQENDKSSSSSSNDGDGSSSCHSCTTPVEDDINFFLRLKRSGRSFLTSSHAPGTLWSTTLGKTATIHQSKTGAPDVVYDLLHEKPDLVNTTSRVTCSSTSSSSSSSTLLLHILQ